MGNNKQVCTLRYIHIYICIYVINNSKAILQLDSCKSDMMTSRNGLRIAQIISPRSSLGHTMMWCAHVPFTFENTFWKVSSSEQVNINFTWCSREYIVVNTTNNTNIYVNTVCGRWKYFHLACCYKIILT